MYSFITPERLETAIAAEVAAFFAFWDVETDGPLSADQVRSRTEWLRDRAAAGDIEMLKEHLGIYPVLLSRKEEAGAALNKLAAKAKRYGTPDIVWTWGQSYYVEQRTETGRRVQVAYVDLVIEPVEAPKVGTFRFIARLEITDAGTIIDTVPGERLPERFRHASNECEHCRNNRARKDLYVVAGEDGKLVQVGRTCLRDYMGTDTPASVAARFRFLRELRTFGEDYGPRGKAMPDTAVELLAVTAAAIRLWGWVPKSAPEGANPTAYRIAVWFQTTPRNKWEREEYDALKAALGEGDFDLAERVIDWVASEEAGDSDYIHNLRVILAPGTVGADRRGYACSAVASYQRFLGKLEAAKRERENAATATNEWVGKVGERLKGLELTVLSNKGFSGSYGPTILYKFRDGSGRTLTWFSSGETKLEVGTTIRLTATVKGHGEYNGVKETQLTRGKVE